MIFVKTWSFSFFEIQSHNILNLWASEPTEENGCIN